MTNKAPTKAYKTASALTPLLAVLGSLALSPGFAADNALQGSTLPPVLNFPDNVKVEFDALFMLDLTEAQGIYADDESVSGASARRARLGISAEIGQRLSAEFAINVDEALSTDSWHEAVVGYEFTTAFSVEAGLLKQPFSLEGNTSSKRLRTLERSLATDAFGPARAFGVAMTYEATNYLASLGAFQGRDDQDIQDVSARVAWAPIDKKRQVLHVGASLNQRSYSTAEYQIESRGNVAESKNFVKSARYNPNNIQTIGLEGAWSRGSLLIQSEWFVQTLALSSTEPDPEFTGGHIQAGWVFGGGYRKYSAQRFGKITGTSDKRSVELVAGLSVLDVRDANRGDKAQEVTLGVNVQVTKNVSFTTQLHTVEVDDNDEGQVSGEGIQIRLVVEL